MNQSKGSSHKYLPVDASCDGTCPGEFAWLVKASIFRQSTLHYLCTSYLWLPRPKESYCQLTDFESSGEVHSDQWKWCACCCTYPLHLNEILCFVWWGTLIQNQFDQRKFALRQLPIRHFEVLLGSDAAAWIFQLAQEETHASIDDDSSLI